MCFIHPDLGIGGAERLIVDAAVALQNKEYQVYLYTAHHDPERCFPETVEGQLRGRVRVFGDWLPRAIFGMFHVFFAILRMSVAAFQAGKTFNSRDHDVVFIVDQIPAVLPILKVLCPNAKILFYCHFPDMLLAPRKSIVAKLYRIPFDFVEKHTTALADKIVANSKFTRNVVKRTFTNLADYDIEILYPSVKRNQDQEEKESKK